MIPSNIFFPLSKFPVEYGYHRKGFNNLKYYLELNTAQNRYTIFCNGGENISSYTAIIYCRLFRCTHTDVYCGYISKRVSLSYIGILLIPMIVKIIHQKKNHYQVDLYLLSLIQLMI